MLIHGDIERNPGLLETLSSIQTKSKKWTMQLIIIHANCQNIQKNSYSWKVYSMTLVPIVFIV